MRGHFRYLRFKTFSMTPRTSQCEVFCPLLSSSEHSGVPEDSQPPTFPSVGLHPHTWPKWGCDNVCEFVMGFPTWAKRKLEENWPSSLSETITKVEGFSDVGRSERSGFKKDNKFLHKKPRHDGEWKRGQRSPTKDKPKQLQGAGFKPKGNFVKTGAPFKGS